MIKLSVLLTSVLNFTLIFYEHESSKTEFYIKRQISRSVRLVFMLSDKKIVHSNFIGMLTGPNIKKILSHFDKLCCFLMKTFWMSVITIPLYVRGLQFVSLEVFLRGVFRVVGLSL